MSECRPTVAEIDLDACARNLDAIRSTAPGLDAWAVVKADAYGHGAVPVARRLETAGAAGFCVATSSEGRELRRGGISRPILVMGPVSPGGGEDPFATAVEYGLAVGVPDPATADALASAARSAGIGPVSAHLKVDTGMGRLGVVPERALELALRIADSPELALDGLLTNLATADSVQDTDPGYEIVCRQLRTYEQVCSSLRGADVLPPIRSVANSSAAEHHSGSRDPRHVTAIRPGLALYGATLTAGRGGVQLEPVMRLVTRVAAIRRLPEGAVVGYGVDTITRRPTRIAVLPLGYHDGLPRSLSSRGQVSLHGRRAPIIGRISMDITLVDVTDLSSAQPGDEVVLFGERKQVAAARSEEPSGYLASLEAAMTGVQDGYGAAGDSGGGAVADRGPLSVEAVADRAGTIPHEILCRVGARVPRRYRTSAGEQPVERSR